MLGDAATIHMRLDPNPWSVRHARQAVQACLDGQAPTDTMRDAVPLASELVTNAVTHTLSAAELIAHYDRLRRRLRIEVRDNSPVFPEVRDDSTVGSAGGGGLRLVDALASRWGTTATATGKTVWCELEW